MGSKAINPQLAPMVALSELLREFPELPPMDWSVSPSGYLHGSWSSDESARPLIDAFAEVLGGVPSDYSYSRNGDHRQGFALRTVWRDVEFDLFVSGPALAVAA